MTLSCFECGEKIQLSEIQVQEIIDRVGEKLPAPSYVVACKCKRSEWVLEVRLMHRGG